MSSRWDLPRKAILSGRAYTLHCDYRDILEIFSYLEDPELPEFIKWQVAITLFYEEPIPEEAAGQAMEYLCWFINCGEEGLSGTDVPLIHWEQDRLAIVADINRIAGTEIRALPFVHWWTFMSWFYAIGEGQLSCIVGIRDKLRRGKRLEEWEQEFYRRNRSRVDAVRRYTREETAQKQALERMLRGETEEAGERWEKTGR